MVETLTLISSDNFYIIVDSDDNKEYRQEIHFFYTQETRQEQLEKAKSFAQQMSQKLQIPLEIKIDQS